MNHGEKKDLVPTCVIRFPPSSAMTARVIVLSVHVGRRNVIIVDNGNEELEVPPDARCFSGTWGADERHTLAEASIFRMKELLKVEAWTIYLCIGGVWGRTVDTVQMDEICHLAEHLEAARIVKDQQRRKSILDHRSVNGISRELDEEVQMNRLMINQLERELEEAQMQSRM
jgi:hypothetical protein